MKKIFFLFLLVCVASVSFAQKRDYQWYFDSNKGMQFNSGSPGPVVGAAQTAIECSSAMADSVTGALLFYMDNDTVYDNTNSKMPNGKGLSTAANPTQMLTLPMPGNKNKYYIVNSTDPLNYGPPSGLSYSVVDMTLNGGKGDVIPSQKNILLVSPTGSMSEGLTAIKHANGYDWWVLSHGLITGQNGKRYYEFLLTSAGVQPVTTQDIGTNASNNTGYLVASPDGKKVCRVDIQGHINLFDFDRCTGMLSNPVDMSEPYNGTTGTGSFYGCAFSPDSKVLYVTEYFRKELFQYDLTAANILLSKILVYSLPPPPFNPSGFGGMQLAPDGKIYFVNTNTKLCAINNPNVLGTGCNPATVASLPWTLVNYTPYFPNYNLGPTTTTAFAGNDTTICTGASVQLSVTAATSYNWSPSTGLSCVTCQNPVASPTSTTTYTVSVSGGCGNSSDSLKVNVVSSLTVNAGSDISICAGTSATLNGSGTGSYLWSPASALSAANISNPVANPTVSTTYTLTVSSGSCPAATDSIHIFVSQKPVANAGVAQTICAGDVVTLNASGGGTYLWSPSAGISNPSISNPTVSPSSTSTYSVVVQVAGICPADTAVVTISVNQSAVANAGVNQTICAGNTASLNAGGGGTYLWIPAAGVSNPALANPTVSPATTTTYSVVVQKGNCAADTDAVTIVVDPVPVANAGSSVSITFGTSAQLSASGGGTYQWTPSTGLDNPSIADPVASPLVTTVYCVTVSAGAGCTDSDCVTIYVSEPLPCGEFYLPNAFSPNDDGENDVFKAYINPDCVKEFKLIIYNRWGEKILVINDVKQSWDGKFRGVDSSQAVYTYYCRVVFTDGKEIKKDGNVSLVR